MFPGTTKRKFDMVSWVSDTREGSRQLVLIIMKWNIKQLHIDDY